MKQVQVSINISSEKDLPILRDQNVFGKSRHKLQVGDNKVTVTPQQADRIMKRSGSTYIAKKID